VFAVLVCVLAVAREGRVLVWPHVGRVPGSARRARGRSARAGSRAHAIAHCHWPGRHPPIHARRTSRRVASRHGHGHASPLGAARGTRLRPLSCERSGVRHMTRCRRSTEDGPRPERAHRTCGMAHGHNSHAMCAVFFHSYLPFSPALRRSSVDPCVRVLSRPLSPISLHPLHFSIFKSERNPGVARHY
jgi:hypothetical protein